MEVYLVGGWVRDFLLRVPSKDRDYVVVGSSPEEMLSLGFTQVGKDFPVFLHPETGDEFALARIERKVGIGYNGFESDWKGVSLADDLLRRDLTINALAQEVVSLEDRTPLGEVIDYFDGKIDLENKVLRPVSHAFMEDPVRVLRAARFLARYNDFKPHKSLIEECFLIQNLGELENLVPERVWLETEKALGEKSPWKYFEYLLDFDQPFMEIFRDMWNTIEDNVYHQEKNVFVHTMMVLKHASENWKDSEINFASLMHDIAKPICYHTRGNGHGHDKEGVQMVEDFCKKWKIPNNYRDLAKITCEQHQKVHGVMGRDTNKMSRPKSIMKIFEQTAALSKPERFKKMLKACESDAKGRIGLSANDDYIQRPYLEECLEAVLSLETKPISEKLLTEGKSGIIIGQVIREERIRKIRGVQNKWKEKLQ